MLAALLGFLSYAAPPVACQEQKIPTTLFSAKLGDASVDLVASGSWSASLSAGIGVLFTPGLGPRPLDQFPVLAQGISFSQTPDLTLSVGLLERYFLQLSVLGGFQDNWILMGYRGAAGEAVRSVLAGNRDITLVSSPFLEVPSQSRGSLGASAELAGDVLTNQLMLRWDATGQRHKLFLGLNELSEQRLGPEAFTPGRYFFLPDGAVSGLTVYLEEAGGSLAGSDGRFYRIATFGDVTIDSAAGLVSLKADRAGRVLAFYTKNGAGVGDPSLGGGALPAAAGGRRDVTAATQFSWAMPPYSADADMAARRVAVDGHDALLLWEPGDQSPFQVDSSYPLEGELPVDPSRVHVDLEARVPGGAPTAGPQFRVLPDESRLVAYFDADFRTTGTAPDGRLLRFLNVYPFQAADPVADINLLYGPSRADLAGRLSFDIVVQVLQPVDRFVLEPGVVPGSVLVKVNGVDERRFEVDAATGALTFQREVLPTDRVEARYRVVGTGTASGDVLAAWRGELTLSGSVTAWFGAGLRWNLGSAAFSDQPYDHTGSVVAAAGIDGSSGPLAWSARAAGSFTDPDTTGVARLHGMEGHGIDVSLLEETAWPSAPPVDPAGPLASLSRANRGRLFYYDYREYGSLGGSTLHPIGWPGATRVPYGTGGRPGPYNVLGSSAGEATGASLAIDFETGTGGWVGVQAPVVAGGTPDLSAAKSISVRLRPYALSGAVQVYVELGALSEDIDGDGVLDAEISAADTGFSFDDPANAAILKVGAGPRLQGNGVRDTEDRDGNGILDLEQRSRVVQKTDALRLAFTGSSAAWTTVTLQLSDADRGKLQGTRGIRVVVTAVGGSTAAGVILVDAIEVDGAGYWISTSNGSGSTTIREVAEPLASRDPGPGARLADVFPREIARLHPEGAPQEVLEAGWQGATGDVLLSGFSGGSTAGAGLLYDTAVAYLRAVGLTGIGDIDFQLSDAAGAGIRWSVSAGSVGDGAWHEVRASRSDGTIRLDGLVVAGVPSFDNGYGQPGHLSVRLAVVGAPASGTLYLDEVVLQDPRAAWGAAGEAELSWEGPGTLLAVGGTPLVANASIREKLTAASSGFSSLTGLPRVGSSFLSRTELGAELLGSRVGVEALIGVDGGAPIFAGSHRVAIPARPAVLSFTDEFSLAATGEFSRENTFRLAPMPAAALSLEAEAQGTTQALTQSWSASLDLGPLAGMSLGVDLGVSFSAAGYPLAAGWYGARWLHEAALLLPWPGDGDLERRESLAAALSGSLGPVAASASIEAAAWSTQLTGVSRQQQNRLQGDVQVSAPLSIAGRDWGSLTFGYTRPLTLAGARGAGDRFAAEAAEFVDTMPRQGYFFAAVPFYELFQDNGEAILQAWSGASTGSWAPTARLAWQRQTGSRPQDLLVPSLVELSVGRVLERTDQLSRNLVSLSQRVAWRAVNLFGRLGSVPLAPFYRTDEFSLGVTSTESGAGAAALTLQDLAVQVFATFVGDRGGSLTLLDSLSLPAASNLLQATFDWLVRPAGGIRLPYLPADVAATGYFEHEEGLQLETGGYRAGHPFTVIGRHSTSIEYPDHGSLKFQLEAGVDTERLAGGGLAGRIAVSGSLQAEIRF